MFEQHEMIPSEALGRHVHLWRYGHWGEPLLVFPSASGMAHEWHAHDMVATLAPLLEAGKIKLYCTESNVAEAWTRRQSDPTWRIGRHLAYEAYVVHELVPWIRGELRSPDARLAVTGCSLGAFYAANFALKHSEIFHWALCMSGRYEVRALTDGFDNQDVYFNNPLAYVPNLHGEALERVRSRTHLVLVCGQGPWEEGCIGDTHALAEALAAKGISHQRDIWGHDVSHGWSWWQRQAKYHLERVFG